MFTFLPHLFLKLYYFSYSDDYGGGGCGGGDYVDCK
jgi:hypothetical protein